MNRKVLLLTGYDGLRPGGGREALSRLVETVLGELAGPPAIIRLSGRTSPLDGLRGRLGGLDCAGEAKLRAQLADPGLKALFLDGSQLGAAAEIARVTRPDLAIITFFHNCETSFFGAALRAAPGVKAAAVLAGHWQAERLAARNSTRVITLSERDSAVLIHYFGRGADVILPLALEDGRDPDAAPVQRAEPYVLFVGGGFFGNLDGLRWYARTIAPALSVRTLVVGRGLKKVGSIPDNVDVVGPVDDLSPWYAGAALVIAPILSGSGMKTKVAEALMHGKRVVGTKEAFMGYSAQVLAANCLCNDAAGFAAAVTAMLTQPAPAFDPAIRALYDRHHSPAAFRAGLHAALVDQLALTSR